jgi:hypothetical protein
MLSKFICKKIRKEIYKNYTESKYREEKLKDFYKYKKFIKKVKNHCITNDFYNELKYCLNFNTKKKFLKNIKKREMLNFF